MKNILLIGALAVAGVALTGCDDFLNDNRYPMSSQTVNAEFWSNSVNVENQVNRFYNDYAGYGDRSGTNGTFYFSWLNDDQCGRRSFADWTFKTVPASSSSWSSPYVWIRGANQVIVGVESGTLNGSTEGNDFIAQARLERARNYFTLVRRYGDVPLIKIPLDPSDEAELYGPRTPREEVVNFIVEDLDYAIANLSTKASKDHVSSDLARAIKLEVCLFEGAYARYHKKDEARANQFFKLAEEAGTAIADKYPINPNYSDLYKSFRTAKLNTPALSSISEVIFYKAYEQGVFMHSLQDYSSASDGIAGLTKDAFDSFLFLDGKPQSSTSYDNTDKGIRIDADDEKKISAAIDITNLLSVRDQRLAMTTYDHVCMPGMTYQYANTASMWSQSGYGVSKYNNFNMPESEVQQANKNYTCAPLYWGARLYCGILEAKAELGNLTDADLAKYMKPLWDRAGFTVDPTLALLNDNKDPRNNMDVSSLIWEIRRLRRCELMMDDDIRYWDLVRWHQLDKLDTTKNLNIAMGANISDSPVEASATIGEYLNCTYGVNRIFEDKYYFYPVPSDQLSLNQKLTQNPGW